MGSAPEGFRVGWTVDLLTDKPDLPFFPADKGMLSVAEAVAEGLKLAPVETRQGARTPACGHGGDRDGGCICGLAGEEGSLVERVQSGRDPRWKAWRRHRYAGSVVPCLIMRSLSDRAGAEAREEERLFEKTAAQNAAALVTGVVGRLEAK